jgi:hypothetical protein
MQIIQSKVKFILIYFKIPINTIVLLLNMEDQININNPTLNQSQKQHKDQYSL